MNLNLERIRWKNLLSYGEMWSEIDLNRSPITLIIGQNGDKKSNGAGKSTFTEAISFCLFGKPIRKTTKGNLINRRNKKGLLTECDFTIDGTPYKVIRGAKPDIFEVYENGELINQNASSRDYQKVLEQKVLRMNFTTFTQSVIVSKTLYTPFMQLTAPKRREYVENILRLQIFGDMLKVHKLKESSLKKQHVEMKSKVDRLRIQYDECERNIDTLVTLIESNTKDKVASLQTQIDAKTEIIDQLVAEYKDKKKGLVDVDASVKSKYQSNRDMIGKLQNRKSDLEESIAKLDTTESNCSMCGNPLSKDHIEKHREELQTKLDKVIEGIATAQSTVDELKSQVDQYEIDSGNNATINAELSAIMKMLSSHKSERDKFQSEISNVSVDTSAVDREREKLDNVRIEKERQEQEFEELTQLLNYTNLVGSMLKDNGIKATIVDKSIPLINQLINQNLNKFGFFVKFELDSEFNETIAVRGFENASYFDFSEGEKLRIDMAILLAWRDIAMLQNAMFCNVLFLDEITDASMDDEGIEIFSSMLNSLKDNNVFVISHKPEKLENIARSSIIIEKIDGYSRIKK